MNGSVVVTGANSGIGYSITKYLNDKGIHVFGCVRRKETLPVFDSFRNVTPVLMDVTDPESVAAAGKQIAATGRSISGVVNNAGVPSLMPLFYSTDEDFRYVFDVNVLGVHRVTNQFIPQLINSRGRIVLIGSIYGVLSVFGAGFYAMSKHAIESYGDTLSEEMRKFGVHVAIVEPGGYASNLGKNESDERKARIAAIADNIYAEEFQLSQQRRESAAGKKRPDPIEVAETVYQALTEPDPGYRYLIVPNAREGEITMRKMIAELLELNRNHRFAYSREQLLEMIAEMYDLDNSDLHFNSWNDGG